MRSPFGSRLFSISFSIGTKNFLNLSLGGSGLHGGIPLLRGEFAVGLLTRSHRRHLFLIPMPMSFGMGSPCGSCVLVGSHLITTEGCHWWLALDPSGWASSLCLRLLFAPCRWRRVSWWSSLWPRVFESSRLSPVFFPFWGPTPLSRMFLSLGPSRSRSPIPSLAPSWWSPCLILWRALMTFSCCVLRVPSAFL